MKYRITIGLWLMLYVFSRICPGVPDLMADPPHNDRQDQSVAQVVAYHQRQEPMPDTVQYVSWTPVVLLANGRYKVTVVFRADNRYGRTVTRKQIVILDESGGILRVMDCR